MVKMEDIVKITVKARKRHICRKRITHNCKINIEKGDLYKPLRIPKRYRDDGDGICIDCLIEHRRLQEEMGWTENLVKKKGWD